ncbi:MAG: glycosyltransferase family 4 protein [Anaerolineae bacterium]
MILFGIVGKGTYWRALSLARGLARRGHQVTVLATSQTRRLRFDVRPDPQVGVTLVESPDVLWGPLRSGWDLWNVISRIIWSHKQQFDLVHAFESRPVSIVPALYWQRYRHTKLILDWCDWFGRGGSVEERTNPLVRVVLRPVETFFEEHFRSQADGTTVINTTLRQKAIDLGVPPQKILLLPNGSDVERLRPHPRTEARRAIRLPTSELVIGYVGAAFRKDAELMARAFDLIHVAEPRARLLLIGYFNQPIEQLVSSPEAIYKSGRLRYDELGLYLAACDVCWLPLCNSGANRGRWPLKLSDYMAVGRPVVATAVGDLPMFFQQYSIGLLARDDPRDLADKVLALFGDPRRREAMGREARYLAETVFTWDRLSGELEYFYYKTVRD